MSVHDLDHCETLFIVSVLAIIFLDPIFCTCRHLTWHICRDAVLALAKTLLGLGISLILPSMTGWIAQSYDYLDSIDGFFLCLSQVFTVFLVSELDPLLFGKANEKVTPRWRSKMIAIVQYVGWNLVFGITALRTSLLILKQFFAGPFMMTDDMIKVLLFCSSFLLLAPYWVIVSYPPSPLPPEAVSPVARVISIADIARNLT